MRLYKLFYFIFFLVTITKAFDVIDEDSNEP